MIKHTQTIRQLLADEWVWPRVVAIDICAIYDRNSSITWRMPYSITSNYNQKIITTLNIKKLHKVGIFTLLSITYISEFRPDNTLNSSYFTYIIYNNKKILIYS